MFEQPESFVSEGVRTLTSDLNRISAAVDSFKTKLRIDLTDLEVEPAVVEVDVWDPMFVFVSLLPLPRRRRHDESVAEWMEDCKRNAPPNQDVRWVYEPRFARGTQTQVYTGDSNCGMYFKTAMEVRLCCSNNICVRCSICTRQMTLCCSNIFARPAVWRVGSAAHSALL